MGLRIGVDGRNYGLAEGTGIATYAATLLTAIRAGGAETELLVAGPHAGNRAARWRAAFAARLGGAGSTLGPGAGPVDRTRVSPDVFRRAQVHFDMWRRLLPVTGPDLPDIMHWTAPLPLRMPGVPNIYTFHDAIPLRVPNRTATDPARFLRLLRAIAASGSHILTVSEATRKEILAAIPALDDRIEVLPQVAEPSTDILALDDVCLDARIRTTLGLGARAYFLFCGTAEPRKNLPALIRAHRAAGTSRPLVIAGPVDWQASEERAERDGAHVIRLGYLDKSLMLCLMRGARALLYPSLAEGFGLPILEAMQLGTPVLTSAGGATEEIAGEAALLVDPLQEPAICACIDRLDSDDDLCRELARRGRQRAALYAPEAYALRLGMAYGRISRRTARSVAAPLTAP